VQEREMAARSRSLRVESEAVGEPASVLGEETRLFRVLTNLVDNALRFSPSGGTVRITTSREGATVTVCVEDDGPGVSPDVLPHLFEKLARGRDRKGGTGLGLFFCRITVENWGGAIGYERREAGGTRFWIRLKSAPGVRDSRRPGRPEGSKGYGEAPDARR
jgi:signal transduction histidine kinase